VACPLKSAPPKVGRVIQELQLNPAHKLPGLEDARAWRQEPAVLSLLFPSHPLTARAARVYTQEVGSFKTLLHWFAIVESTWYATSSGYPQAELYSVCDPHQTDVEENIRAMTGDV